jgi:hypothetical protein
MYVYIKPLEHYEAAGEKYFLIDVCYINISLIRQKKKLFFRPSLEYAFVKCVHLTESYT